MRGHGLVRSGVAALLLAAAGGGAGPACAQTCELVAEGTTWLWHAEPAPADWNDPDAVDDPELSDWQGGCTPFSSTGCGFAPGTFWTPGTNLVVRQHVWLTGAEFGLTASIAIDNDYELWVNGAFVDSLVHEGCATRWDAVVPIPDGLLRVGDNVVALRLIDRGGITNFEMTLTASSTEPCPPQCALLPCGAPGPAIVVPDGTPCPGRYVSVTATGGDPSACPTGYEYRFRDELGRVVRDWDGPDWWVLVGDDVAMLTAEARCAHSPTCPVGSGLGTFQPPPGPPQGPGPTLRLSKSPAGVVLEWSGAPPLGPGEHDHVLAAERPDGAFVQVNDEGETSRSWTDAPDVGAPWHYLVRVADDCERTSR